MCITPNWIDTEKGSVLVACHKCWQCASNRINDYCGRAIAESHYSKKTLAITLTYGDGDTPEAAILTYSDVQKFMKRVRHYYGEVRYIVAGEYGGEKGRAHWHIILFFKGKYPNILEPNLLKKSVLEMNPTGTVLEKTADMCLERKINNELWPHGYMFVEQPCYGAFRYILKYVMKEQEHGKTAVRNLGMSKQPPLGHEYFRELASKHVEQGLAPRSFEYSFDDEYDDNGKRRGFFIQGKSRENYMQYFVDEWERVRGIRPPSHDIIINHARINAEIEDYEFECEAARNIDWELEKFRIEANALQANEVAFKRHRIADRDRHVILDATRIIEGYYYGVRVMIIDRAEFDAITFIYEGLKGVEGWFETDEIRKERLRNLIVVDRLITPDLAKSYQDYVSDWQERGKTH